MLKPVYTLAVAAVGGLIGVKLKLPAGALIGAMLAVGVYNLLSNQADMPSELRVGIQIAAGAMIGARVTRDTLMGLKEMLVPAIIMVAAVLAINFLVGYIIFKTSRLDLATSLYASAPGGMTEMTLAADAMGADAPKVAILQLIRLLCVLSFLPFLQKLVIGFLARGD
ncbi:MAG: AbrB family transcriptional regulator [Bacteroidota bacterium]